MSPFQDDVEIVFVKVPSFPIIKLEDDDDEDPMPLIIPMPLERYQPPKKEYRVDEIIRYRVVKLGFRVFKHEFFVKWTGFEFATWEPITNLINSVDHVLNVVHGMSLFQKYKLVQEFKENLDSVVEEIKSQQFVREFLGTLEN